MKNTLLNLWQFPQIIAGLILVKFAWKNKLEELSEKELRHLHGLEKLVSKKIYIVKEGFLKKLASFSFGHTVILKSGRQHDKNCVKHECIGHALQSRRFGIFYLPFVGVASVTLNIINRFHKIDYYSFWPENQADKLGGVVRSPSWV